MSHKINLSILSVLTAILIAPAIFHNDALVELSRSADQATHINVISQLQFGQPLPQYNYLGQVILGFPMVLLNQVFGWEIKTLFIWLNAIALVGVVVSLYLVFCKLVSKTAGLLAVLLAVFAAKGIITLFACSITFGMINLFITLPWAIYSMVKWLTSGQIRYIILAMGLFGLFSVFHPTGLYLLPMIILWMAMIFVYHIKEWRQIAETMAIFGGIAVFSLLLSQMFIHNAAPALINTMSNLSAETKYTVTTVEPVYAIAWFVKNASYAMLAVLAGSVLGLVMYRKQVKISRAVIYAIMAFASLAASLAIVTFSKMSIEPIRTQLDLISILALVGACLAGILFKISDGMIRIMGLACFAVIASEVAPYLLEWTKIGTGVS